ncbi:hypothetical protein ACFFGH_31470 [Lysobacter korlensis]|uniref:Nucleotide exchange factor GrpE n=1 Tax=Lysobacter korlensis TaxID=553636 RepID=A0ABV6S2P3_9GAMM
MSDSQNTSKPEGQEQDLDADDQDRGPATKPLEGHPSQAEGE